MAIRDWFTSKAHRAATDLGNVLLAMGMVTQDQLGEAVKRQVEDRDQRLGQILLRMGVVTPSDLERALAAQRSMRRGRAAEAMADVVAQRWDVVQDALKRA